MNVQTDRQARAAYPNTDARSHRLPEPIVPILGHLVEGGQFLMRRKNTQTDSGIKVSGEVEPGGNFMLFVSEWYRDASNDSDDTLLSMTYSWDGDFLAARINDSDSEEEDGVAFLREAVAVANLQVDSHDEVYVG
jgi:hypothetical protein